MKIDMPPLQKKKREKKTTTRQHVWFHFSAPYHTRPMHSPATRKIEAIVLHSKCVRSYFRHKSWGETRGPCHIKHFKYTQLPVALFNDNTNWLKWLTAAGFRLSGIGAVCSSGYHIHRLHIIAEGEWVWGPRLGLRLIQTNGLLNAGEMS